MQVFNKRPDFIQKPTFEKAEQLVINNLPHGDFWDKKRDNTTFFYTYLFPIITEFYNILNDIYEFWQETDPMQATKTIERWEKFVGLPDDTTPISTDINERRLNVIVKLYPTPINTQKEYEDFLNYLSLPYIRFFLYGEVFGDGYDYTFDIPFLTDDERAYTMVWELYKNQPTNDLLKKILNKIKPAHIKFIYYEI